jgi:uncharacterized lipoprotein YddW (UPF0748 family)
VRGVWLTNVDSRVLESREGIAEAMQFLADHHFNLVCPVVWNKSMTQYRSQLMDSLFGQPIDTLYGDRDPLAELIEEAHQRDLAVIAWFEFGFSASHKARGGYILEKFPHWAARDQRGELLTKNGFEWMNAYHPEVRTFMKNMMLEVAYNYDVDGVQGDDRLPAQPSEGGYSDYTIELYRNEHKGTRPPDNHLDQQWLEWRADKLNQFAEDTYRAIKETMPELMVTWAPSLYPWSFTEYLQEWPAWVKGGYADLIIPQHYRYSVKEYKQTLDDQLAVLDSVNGRKNTFYPGILMNVGDYLISEKVLIDMVQYNREKGINGEIYFFYEGLRKQQNKLAKVLKERFYKHKAEFPF